MVKKIVIRAGVLTAMFIAAVILFSYLTNRSNTDMSADMGSATLPQITFSTEGYTVNTLSGYRQEMDIPTMRDTITPVTNSQLDIGISAYDADVTELSWQVYTLDGEEMLQEDTVSSPEDTVTVQFDAQDVLAGERVLRITLQADGNPVYYYTRIVDSTDTNYKTCLDFAQNFLTAEMDKDQQDALSGYLESGSDTGSGFQRVTINSSIDNVTWGSLEPEIRGDVRWEIRECNETYTSIVLSYRVRCPGAEDNAEAEYDVEEFFRIRVSGDNQYLLNYNRTMNQKFNGRNQPLDENGILLGIAPSDLEYCNNDDGTIVSFVQNRELWNYDGDTGELSQVFSFAESESRDARNLVNRHEIHIVSVEDNGSTTFLVCGYMNRGDHEGETGVAVYYFDAEKNYVEEKAFVPSTKGYYVMKEELGKLVYYSSENECLYAMINGALYCVNLAEDTREVLVRGLEDGQYQVSEDGRLIAYQSGGTLNESQTITILNLETGDSFDITSEGEEYIRPIGFIRNDLAYGTMRAADAGQTSAGQSIFPMYKVDIVSLNGENVESYEVADIYILDGYIEENMLTLTRATRNGNVYTGTSDDYITNNEAVQESNITLESYTDSTRGRVMRLRIADGVSDTTPRLLQPRMVLRDTSTTVEFDDTELEGRYYVYALGELQGVYDHAGFAVQRADALGGVAVTSRQAYLFERGNLSTVYEVENTEAFSAAEGESTLAACLNYILTWEGKQADVAEELANGTSPEDILTTHTGEEGLDLSGCSVEEILYTISRETPVIAMLSDGHAVLLIGYNQTNVAYLDPADGQRYSVSKTELESMVNAFGNTFIGYAK